MSDFVIYTITRHSVVFSQNHSNEVYNLWCAEYTIFIDRNVQTSCNRDMKISIAKFLLTVIFYIDVTNPEDIEIARLILDEGKDPWKRSTDLFNIDQSACEDVSCSSECNTGQNSQ